MSFLVGFSLLRHQKVCVRFTVNLLYEIDMSSSIHFLSLYFWNTSILKNVLVSRNYSGERLRIKKALFVL